MDFAGIKVKPEQHFVRGIAQGAVTAGKTVSVKFASGTAQTCLAQRDLTTAAGDVVLGIRDQGRVYIFTRLYAAAPTAPDAESGIPDFEPAIREGSFLLYPVETRSYSTTTDWLTAHDNLLHGTAPDGINYTGCAFFGTGGTALSGATVTGITMKVKRLSGGHLGLQSSTIQQITDTEKPEGIYTTTGATTAGPVLAEGETDTFTLPTAWGSAIAAGTTGGIAFIIAGGSPYIRFGGRHDYSPSMLLKIDWERAT